MNALTEITAFVRVVDLGGFTRAAAQLALTPSGVSRMVSRLEVILEHLEPPPRVIHALFARPKAKVPKVRVFVDFLAELLADGTEAKRRRRVTAR